MNKDERVYTSFQVTLQTVNFHLLHATLSLFGIASPNTYFQPKNKDYLS